MATYYDLVRRIMRKPDMPEELAEFILWNGTCYPFGSALQVARQLRDTREAHARGMSVCCMCGAEYRDPDGRIVLGGECGAGGNCAELVRIAKDQRVRDNVKHPARWAWVAKVLGNLKARVL